MELSGQMDSLDKFCNGSHDFGNFDLSDEEVHFSRGPAPGGSVPLRHSHVSQQSAHIHRAKFTEINLDNSQIQETNTDSEQLRSTKLLNSIGSKLRRGSNYLIAPKLVGQYLLGITIQNWSEFLNTSRMMKTPSSTNQLTRRLVTNLNHFQGNYLCVSLILIIYCILTSPLLLLAIIVYLAGIYFITARSATGRQLKILNCRPNLQQQYSFLTLVSIPLLWVAGAPSAVFWVIGASCVVIGLHASMYNPEKVLHEPLAVENQRVAMPYYSHYHIGGYSNLSVVDNYTTSLAREQQNQSQQQISGYSNSFAQWISFGSLKPANSQANHSIKASQTNEKQTPSVKIISQDFAGLGRVYEV